MLITRGHTLKNDFQSCKHFNYFSWIYESSGGSLNYSNWGDGEGPNKAPDPAENCGTIALLRSGKWVDYPCKYKIRFICEKDFTLG